MLHKAYIEEQKQKEKTYVLLFVKLIIEFVGRFDSNCFFVLIILLSVKAEQMLPVCNEYIGNCNSSTDFNDDYNQYAPSDSICGCEGDWNDAGWYDGSFKLNVIPKQQYVLVFVYFLLTVMWTMI